MSNYNEADGYTPISRNNPYPFHRHIEKCYLEKIRAEKRVRVLDAAVAPNIVVSTMLNYVDMINSLEPDASTINGYLLSDLMIINEFKDLVNPGEIRLDANDYSTTGLLVKPENVDVSKFSLFEFEETQTKFRSYFKKDLQSDRTSLLDLRKSVSLMDVISKCAIPVTGQAVEELVGENNKKEPQYEARQLYVIKYDQSLFIPIPIKVDIRFLCKSFYFNSVPDEIINDYFAKLKF